jgi:proteasome lid subunit RPN8/RPN11
VTGKQPASAMPDFRLLIASPLLDQLRNQAVLAHPRECCGLLVGRRNKVAVITRLIACDNCHPEPTQFFTVEPAQQLAALLELRALEGAGDKAETLLGVYHSHPQGPAAPSPRDLDAAQDSEMIWLIIDATQGAIAAFQPLGGEDGAVTGFAPMTIIPTVP